MSTIPPAAPPAPPPRPSRRGMVYRAITIAVIVGLISVALLAAYVYYSAIRTFEIRRVSLPTRIYTDAYTLASGVEVTRDQVVERMERLGYRETEQPAQPGVHAEAILQAVLRPPEPLLVEHYPDAVQPGCVPIDRHAVVFGHGDIFARRETVLVEPKYRFVVFIVAGLIRENPFAVAPVDQHAMLVRRVPPEPPHGACLAERLPRFGVEVTRIVQRRYELISMAGASIRVILGACKLEADALERHDGMSLKGFARRPQRHAHRLDLDQPRLVAQKSRD